MDNNHLKESQLEKKTQASPIKKILQFVAPLILGVLILYFLYKDTDFDSMWHIIKEANCGILLLSLIFGPLGNVVRGVRWQLLTDPLGYETKKRNLIYAVLGSYAVNFLLPRAGEVWRCGVIAKKESIPFTKLLSTIIIDRMFDSIMVALLVLLAFAFNVSVFANESSQFVLPEFLFSWWFYLAGIAGFVLMVLILKVFSNNPLVKKINGFLSSLWDGMKVAWGMKNKNLFFFYTVLIWICYFLYFYITFFAFGFTSQLGVSAGLFVFAVSSVSMAIPSNGGLGPWQAAVVFGLVAFGVASESAIAFATAVFASQSLWLVLVGLAGIAGLSISKSKK